MQHDTKEHRRTPDEGGDPRRAELEATLRANGHRVTEPRRAVWAALHRARGHLTVEELTAEIAAAGTDVDLASVYRTLDLFEQLDLARMSRLGDTDAGRWELAHPDEHFHLVCIVCGNVDHHVGSLVAGIREHLEQGHGFEPDRVELVVSGRCRHCREDGTSIGCTDAPQTSVAPLFTAERR